MKKWLIVLTAVLVAGCASFGAEWTGQAFLCDTKEPQPLLDGLAKNIAGEARTLADVRAAIAGVCGVDPERVKWEAHYSPDRRFDGAAVRKWEQYVWRFGHVPETSLSAGIVDYQHSVVRGYQLAVDFENGRVVMAHAKVEELPTRLRKFLTHRVFSIGTAAFGTFLVTGN